MGVMLPLEESSSDEELELSETKSIKEHPLPEDQEKPGPLVEMAVGSSAQEVRNSTSQTEVKQPPSPQEYWHLKRQSL